MAAAGGPNSVEQGLIFQYDIANTERSYFGKPGTNITTGKNLRWAGSNSSTFSNGKLFESFGGESTEYIPTLGYSYVKYMELYNVYSGYGADGNYNCCPSLFGYGDGIPVTGNTVYTYQIVYKTSSGYTNPNYMYHYEYGPSGYITEYGVHTTSQREHLGNGWYHAWANFTTNANAISINTGMWHYEYNTKNTVYLAAVSITEGNSIRPPKQFIKEASTRLATESLIDIVRGTKLNLENTSFDTNGKIVFDGTNDYISTENEIACNFGTGDFSIEVAIYPQSFSSYTHMVSLPLQDKFTLKANAGDGAIYYYDPSFSTYGSTPGANLLLNKWNYVTFIRKNNIAYVYLNGELKGSKTGFNTNFSSKQIANIGWGWATEFTQKKIDVVKIYNRALTTEEVKQNYNTVKLRFNI